MSVLFSFQQEVLAPFVAGEEVLDLGCGDMRLSKILLDIGARRVVGIDKSDFTQPRGVEFFQCYFHNVPDLGGPRSLFPFGVVFISWPNNNPGVARELVRLTQAARIVIYLGSNTEGNACADPLFFQDMLTRALLVHAPHKTNTMLVYGSRCEQRQPVWEEIAGLLMYDTEDVLRYQS